MPFQPGPRKPRKDGDGETVYPCLWIGCNKSFGTAQHVRRHEKTHVGNTPYPCAYCDKSFGRSDVRAKHVSSMHPDVSITQGQGQGPGQSSTSKMDGGGGGGRPREEAHFRRNSFAVSEMEGDDRDEMSPPPSKAPRFSIHDDVLKSKSAVDGINHQDSVYSNTFTYQPQPSMPDGASAISISPISATAMGTGTSPTIALSGPAGMMLPPAQPQMGTPFSIASSHSSGFIDPTQLSVGPSVQPLPNIDLGLATSSSELFPGSSTDLAPPAPFDPSWEWFGHVFGWGADEDIDLGIGLQNSMFERNGVGPVSSTDTLSAAWVLCATPRGGSPVGEEGDINKGKPRGMEDPFGRGHESPWPNIFKPKVPDRPLTLAGVKASPRPRRVRTDPTPDAISETSRNAMLSLVYLSHQPHWLMPDVDDFPDQETLSDFVDLYFERFYPLFPVIHKPTFLSDSDTPPVLLLSVAAIGATYADPEFAPLAVALCELVRRMIAWMRGSDQRAKFDKHALLAFVHQTALGMACGSREMFYHAEIFRCSIVTTCRRLHLLRGIGTATDELYAKDADPPLEARYKAYLEDETRRRLGWGVYLLDSQMAALLHIPAIFSASEAAIRLPTEEVLWEAPNAEIWQEAIVNGQALDPKEHRPKFLYFLARGLGGLEQGEISDFACAIVAHTVWRMLSDEHQSQRVLGVGQSANGMALPTVEIDQHVLDSKPGQLLLRLARSTFPTSNAPSQLRLTPTALFHYAHIHFTRPGLMDRIRNASGKHEPDMTDAGSLEWLRLWSSDQSKEVRKVLWHAGVLQAICAEFPRGSPAELFFTFDCALVFWAVVKYASSQLLSNTFRSALFAANWFDTAPPEMWLSHGGQIVFPFLGASGEWTMKSLLTLFMDRLEGMPWGLASQYRLVLRNLLESGNSANADVQVKGGSK